MSNSETNPRTAPQPGTSASSLPQKTERGHRGGIVGMPSDARGGNVDMAPGIPADMPQFFKIAPGGPTDLPAEDKRGPGGMESDARERDVDLEEEVADNIRSYIMKGSSRNDEQVGDKTQK